MQFTASHSAVSISLQQTFEEKRVMSILFVQTRLITLYILWYSATLAASSAPSLRRVGDPR
ncbi:hypothetical protein TYRP_003523 [Tyrophagus putrescentiae]|nr:hypothetical protein TYRP_003523 [Tyrophagus putrescentiae]